LSAQATRLPFGLVEDVLMFLDVPGYPERSPAGLSVLYRRWCRMVPFDNIRKLIALRGGAGGPLPGDDAEDFFRALLDDRVGGTCWAGNGALCVLLQSLGFDAVRALGTMRVAPGATPGIPPNHGSVLVRFGVQSFVVDASILMEKPLEVIPGRPSGLAHPAWGVAGFWEDGAFTIRWRPLHRTESSDCRIDRFEVDAERFRVQHEATRAWDPFNQSLAFDVIEGEGRVGIAGGQAVAIDGRGMRTARPLGDRVAYLVDVLGVAERIAARIPPDLETPPPPGSQTTATHSDP
jgi:N-hydroxyarylamine O-acetyltransferase